ncbi:MAG: DNA polymerase III subunit beta [Planctomycetaceae bacterium]|nr:DNA polymerase III subunit beta [Planctomycetales bacterium]MCB9873388.1 DNA polymerase III subunit beta [Planctomycetaceae bacterium]MCB9941202.1 DNA polymerase III subunit beta [Planctomycetaceae bacterium]
MKITCDREQLLTAFMTAATVAPSRSPKPILRNIKLEVTSEVTTLMATDMEVGIRIEVSGIEVDKPGTILAPVSLLGSILRESNDDKLTIESDENGTIVRGERSEFKLPAENPDEFPVVASFSEEAYHEVPIRLFKELVRRTLFATDAESSRYALGGVLLEMEADKITAVATDGRRLAKMEGPAKSVGGHGLGDTMTIVPSRAMQLMERALTDAGAEIQIAARANDIMVRSPRATIYARLVEGRFPKWREVFPSRQDSVQIEVTVGPFYSTLRQAAIVASEESRGIDFTFGNGTLVLAGSTAEVGQSRVELPIAYDGEAITVTMDHRFVADFLKVLDNEKSISIDIRDAESAALFTTDDGYGYVVMPLAREQ